MALEGQTAIVTGAGGGIARAISLQLASDGADVAALDLEGGAAEATAAQVQGQGRRALGLRVDVVDREQVHAAVNRVAREWGRIDMLITCAGIFPRRPILEIEEDEWDRVIGVHLKGTFLCCQAVLPHMIERRYGRIVTTVSGLSGRGRPQTAAYAAAKGGIVSFTRVLATEAAPHGITVNAFGPGPTDTPMFHGGNREHAQQTVRQMPFGRLATPAESAELAVWFVRPETTHVTGRVFMD